MGTDPYKKMLSFQKKLGLHWWARKLQTSVQ